MAHETSSGPDAPITWGSILAKKRLLLEYCAQFHHSRTPITPPVHTSNADSSFYKRKLEFCYQKLNKAWQLQGDNLITILFLRGRFLNINSKIESPARPQPSILSENISRFVSQFANPQDLWLPTAVELQSQSSKRSTLAPLFLQTPSTSSIDNFVSVEYARDIQDLDRGFFDDSNFQSSPPDPTISTTSSTSGPSQCDDTDTIQSSRVSVSQGTFTDVVSNKAAEPVETSNGHSQLPDFSIGGRPETSSTTIFTSSTSPISSTAPNSAQSSESNVISCEFLGCQRTFTRRHIYNKHKKSHDHPEHCPHCGRGFETSKDVTRHIKDKHTQTKDFHCTVTGCKYARGGRGGGFGRKENWKRHLLNQHGISDESPSLSDWTMISLMPEATTSSSHK